MKPHRRYSLRNYSALKITIAMFVVVYGIVAYQGGAKSERGEYFPVFNWSLFTYVKSVRGLTELHVKRIGAHEFERPVNFFELDEYFPTASARSSDLKKNLERLVRARARGDQAQVATLRKLIETRHLSGHGSVEYALVYVVFSPVERWKTGRTMRESVIAQWETGPRT